MAKVVVDEEACIGCGLCEQKCPDIFELQDDGKAHVKAHECSDCDLQEVVEMCPVTCITVS